MTIQGAIAELKNLLEDDDIPFYYKPAIKKVIETIRSGQGGEWIDKGWKGDWQFETDGRGTCWYEYECSECGFRNKGSKSNFCPNCGAKMKGADDEYKVL